MTRLPHESRLVVDRPDLPEYELNTYCAVPDCHEVREIGGGHHLFRRSAGYPSWWVQLEDGTVIGNRIGLCPMHHHLVTVNKTRIIWKYGNYWWINEDGKGWEMSWQPPKPEAVNPEISPSANFSGEIPPGEECPSCKRRVPHPKKKSSPSTSVFSTRVPIDDADTFKSMVDAAAEHMGIKAKPHFVYNVLLTGVTLVLQSPKEHLPGG